MKPIPRLPASAVALMLASAGMFLLPLRGADNAAASPAAGKPALAKPGPLPDGTIELLAITNDHLGLRELTPSEISALKDPADRAFYEGVNNSPWWKADGSPAQKYQRNPLKPQDGFISDSMAGHSSTYRIFFRTKTNPPDATWSLSGLGSSGWSFRDKKGPGDEAKTVGGKLASDLVCFITDIVWGDKQVDLTVSVASGPWESLAKVGANPKGPGISALLIYNKEGYAGEGEGTLDNQHVAANIRRNDAHWSLEMKSAEISDGDKRTHSQVTLIHNINTGRPEKPLEWEVRVIAIDQSGKEHLSDTDSFGDRTLTHAFSNTAYEFRDLPSAQAKEFILQVRPFQSQKFRHVALEPKSAVTPTTPTPQP